MHGVHCLATIRIIFPKKSGLLFVAAVVIVSGLLSVVVRLPYLLPIKNQPETYWHQTSNDQPTLRDKLFKSLGGWLRRATTWLFLTAGPIYEPRLQKRADDEFPRITNDTSVACRHFDLPLFDPKIMQYYDKMAPQQPLNCSRETQWAVLKDDNKIYLTDDPNLDLTCNVTGTDDCHYTFWRSNKKYII
jgi:hypothetical protein